MAMNLIDIAEELEFVPKADLAAMIDNPNSRYPSFMVLSEIQRRTKMEKMFETARMQTPQTTVAEEAVMEMTGIGAMPMQAGMSSPVNSQGSGLQGMAPPTLTAQTGLFTSQEQLIARLKRLAEQGDINAQRDLQQLTQKLGDISNFVFDDTSKDLSATMPSASQSLMTLPKDLTEGFPYQRPEFQSVDLSLTEPKDLTEGFDYKRPPFKGLPQFGLTTEEERDKFRGFARTDLPLGARDLFAIGKTERAGIEKELAERAGLSQMQPDQVTPETTGELTQAGVDAGLQLAQRLKQNNLTNPQFRMLNKSDDVTDDTAQAGLASANNPDLTDIQKRYQEEIDKIFTPADEFVSQLGDPVTLRTREQITEDVSSRLNLPEVTALKPTEEERQRDMNVALLTGLGAVIGGAKRPGDIATGIGKLGSDIAKMRRDARKEDRLADRLTRQENIQNINLISGIVNAEQAAERATKQLQIQERKDFDAGQLAKTQLEISRAKLVEGGLRLELAERANATGLAKFNLDEIKALQQQAQNLQASLISDPLIASDPTKIAKVQGQIDALNAEINRRFNVPEFEQSIQDLLKTAQKQ